MKIIELTEYKPQLFPHDYIPTTIGETLWRNYSKQVAVDFHSTISLTNSLNNSLAALALMRDLTNLTDRP